MRIGQSVLATLISFSVLSGCAEVPDPIGFDAMGGIVILTYVDRDGDHLIDQGFELPATGLSITLESSDGRVVGSATVPVTGEWRTGPLPVGSYRVVVPPNVLGDSLVTIGDHWIDVVAGDTVLSNYVVGYPTVSVSDLANARVGRMVAVEGVTLNPVGNFSDSLVHVVDADVVARAVMLRSSGPLAVGDTARILGRVGQALGRRALLGASAFSLRAGSPPVPTTVTASAAASAMGGTADGALVTVANARVLSVTNLPGGGLRVRVSDSSGVLDVVIDREINLVTSDPLVPGADLTTTGVLVPVATEPVWTLRPRGSQDVTVSIAAATVQAVISLPLGSVVSVTGVALNGVAGFGDQSLHFADSTGSMRALSLNTSFIFEGNQVRVSGVTTLREGRVVILPATVTVLGQGQLPPPVLVNTAAADSANGGQLDAALVEVRNVVVDSIGTQGGESEFRVADGSGRLIVRIDGSTGIAPGTLQLNRRANIVGVLVPTGGAKWVLKPRAPGDVTILP